MKKKQSSNFIAPILTIVISCGIGFYLFSGSNSAPAVAVPEPKVIVKEAPTVQILVATSDIPVGRRLNINDLSWRAWPESLLNPQYITQNEKPDYINTLVGGIVKTSLLSGEPIVEGKIIYSGGRGAMAVLLRKGMRAVSVPISVSTAVGGFILPGDYVDIILTAGMVQQNLFTAQQGTDQTREPVVKKYLTLKALAEQGRKNNNSNDENLLDSSDIPNTANFDAELQSDTANKENTKISKQEMAEQNLLNKLSQEDELLITNGSNISEMLLENVKVLAIDQTLDTQNNASPEGQPGGGSAILGATATLEVTPEQAKLLAWSSSAGNLTLSLRAFGGELSKKEQNAINQRVPVTKTSFAWPFKVFDSQPEVQTPKKIELIRNGNTSILYNQNSAKVNNNNMTGGPNVQR